MCSNPHATGDNMTLILPGLLGVSGGAGTVAVTEIGEGPGKAAFVAAVYTVADLVLTRRV